MVVARAMKSPSTSAGETPRTRLKPVYEAMVAAGFLRKCIPASAGGDNAGLIDLAIMAEEFYGVNASITLTMLATMLGLLPILFGGTPEQAGRLLKPFLTRRGALDHQRPKKMGVLCHGVGS